jgi:CRP-like cAMP-binding protein
MGDEMILLPILKKIPVLQGLNESDHKEIIKNITGEFFAKNFVIFNEGDEPDGLYIINTGQVRIFHPNPGGEPQEVAILSNNDFFGEMALISDKPRSASAVATKDTVAFMLTKKDFLALLSLNSEIAGRIHKEASMRTQQKKRQ